MGGIHGSYNDRYWITLLRDEYLDLLDFISDFTGIERELMHILMILEQGHCAII